LIRYQQRASWRAVFKPLVIAAIDLHELAEALAT
jgi:hypothetical protein